MTRVQQIVRVTFAIFVWLLLVAPAVAQSPRQRFRMDFGWKFTLGDPPQAESPRFDDSAWRQLDVPHDWSIEGPWKPDNPSGRAGGFAPIGIGWYRKSFRLPPELAGKRLYLDFDGVFNRADVWVNGQKVGHNENGYVSFECDITPWARTNRDNVIAVRVDNLKQASRWYTGSGIYRHVWLVATDPVHVAHWGTYVTTPEVRPGAASVEIRTTLRNDTDENASRELVARIADPGGKPVTAQSTQVEVPARGETTVTQKLSIPDPQLWSLETPVLYRATSELRDAGRVLDDYHTPFGIRTIKFDVNHGFQLNGKRVVIKGVCLHHDLGALGAAALGSGIEERLKVLKTIGVNAIRLSHNPNAPEILDLADRMGLLVFDEAYDKWYGLLPDGTGWKHDLTSFILNHRNHPSIFIWSVGNEMTPHMYLREGTLLYQAMQNAVHELDPTRPVTAALHPVRNNKGERDAPLAEIASYMDVISMNYQTRFYARDHQQHPNQVLLGSEVHLHQLDLNAPRDPKDNSGNQWWGTRDYTTGEYYPYVAGQFIWAGVDYLGESEGWPSKGYRTTLVSMTNARKPWSYFIQSLYSDAPMVAIAVDNPDFKQMPKRDAGGNFNALLQHWNFPASLTTLRVYTFSNAPATELRLNGRSLGEKRAADFADHIVLWDVPNQPGKLEAIAKRDGAIVASSSLQSAGTAVRLRLVPNRTKIEGTGEDLAYVSVEALDANGVVVPDVRNLVQFEVGGEGSLAGVDNADLDSPELFKTDHRELRLGRALAIVQSARMPGRVRITAKAAGLEPASVEIDVEPPAHAVPTL
jgi:beta-galactosidase